MRSALAAAQKMANSMVSEAEERKETLLADAEMQARAKIGALHDEIVLEQRRLNELKAQTQDFVARIRLICESQLKQLETIPDLTPEQLDQTTSEVQKERSAAVDIAALGERIVASYERKEPEDQSPTSVFQPQPAKAQPAPENTLLFPAVNQQLQQIPKRPKRAQKNGEKAGGETLEPDDSPFVETSAHPARLDDLKFGRNYRAEDEE